MLDTWVPHVLTVENLVDRVSICEPLLKRNEIEPFLNWMITGDEKWITYDNNVVVVIVVEARRSFTNGCKARIDAKEGDAEYLVGLERNCSSWAARTWPNH